MMVSRRPKRNTTNNEEGTATVPFFISLVSTYALFWNRLYSDYLHNQVNGGQNNEVKRNGEDEGVGDVMQNWR